MLKVPGETYYRATTTFPAGSTVRFRGKNPKHFNTTYNGAATLRFEQPVSLSGSVMALLDNGTGTAKSIPCDYCFHKLFVDSKIMSVSKDFLPATKLKPHCYQLMFQHAFVGDVTVDDMPNLPAEDLATECYHGMFMQNPFTDLSEFQLPADKLVSGCYESMFSKCEDLVKAPQLHSMNLAADCYMSMFSQCTSLKNLPVLPAQIMKSKCYYMMFYKTGLTGLTGTEPDSEYVNLLSSVKELAPQCFDSMFCKCSNLAIPLNLPLSTLETGCYARMFNACSQLAIPDGYVLPATVLPSECYLSMFAETATEKTPIMHGIKEVGQEACKSMFNECENLSNGSNITFDNEIAKDGPCTGLPGGNTIIKTGGCQSMFFGCKNLISAPVLYACQVFTAGYYSMFSGCESLPSAHVHFTTFNSQEQVAREMFRGCSNLKEIWLPYLSSFARGIDCTFQWVADISKTGKIYCTAELLADTQEQFGKLDLVFSSDTFPYDRSNHWTIDTDPTPPTYD